MSFVVQKPKKQCHSFRASRSVTMGTNLAQLKAYRKLGIEKGRSSKGNLEFLVLFLKYHVSVIVFSS